MARRLGYSVPLVEICIPVALLFVRFGILYVDSKLLVGATSNS